MSAVTTSVAQRLNVATVTQYLSSQTSLAASLTGDDKRRAVLLRSAPEWDGPAEPVWDGGRTARIAAAPSPLAVHELVLDHLAGRAGGVEEAGGAEDEAGPAVLVILTNREQKELDPAILARAHKQRISTVDRWDVVREAFGAEAFDPRLREASWAAEALLDASPPGGWPPIAGGMLSWRTALSALALRRLRLGRYSEPGGWQNVPADDALDTQALLSWSLNSEGPAGLLELRGPERAGLTEFLSEQSQAGPAGRALLALVEAEHGDEAVAFGLVCGALWLHAAPDAETYRARGRAERWFGEQPPASGEEFDALVSVFARTCEAYVGVLLTTATRTTGTETDGVREARRTVETVVNRATALVQRFGAESAAQASPLLPAALDAGFTAMGRALETRRREAVAAAVRSLGGHKRAELPEVRPRVERARMSGRLVQWLAGDPAVETGTTGDALERHVAEIAWVDRALEHIEAGGDPDPVLKSAYDNLAACVRERRHEIDRDFARKLANWTAAGSTPGSMLTVESFLERVVKPVVRGGESRRVLLIVVDGMSAAIAGELGEELRSSWAEFDLFKEGSPRRRAMAAALPTLTSVSRTSLFAGTLTKGTQADEKRLFPVLKLWSGAPAAVFHKDDLRAESAGQVFGPALDEAISDGHTHVAVVLNAVDDRLAKEQKLGDGSWRAEHIPGLSELLREAAAQGMAVIVTSDHGHVVDRHGTSVEAGAPESARHRTAGGPLETTEVALSGPRVVWPEPGASIVALWDADSHYTGRKAGYHGGASLAEVAIPVLAFLPFGATPPREWRELGDQRPTWWSLDESATLPAPSHPDHVSAAKKPSRHKSSKGQSKVAETHDALFDVAAAPAGQDYDTPASTTAVAPTEKLVTALFASAALQDQLALLARTPRESELNKFKRALLALLDAGGTLPITAMAQRADHPPTRADGFAAVLRQLLNFDGVQVLETLPDGRTLRLHQAMMREQFGLG
jgi:hypothetical protein